MKIGIISLDYPTIRNVYKKINDSKYIVLRKNNNLFHSIKTFLNIIYEKNQYQFKGKFYKYRSPKIDILHLFNDINYSKQKWVTTFETLVPRFEETQNFHQKEIPFHETNTKTENGFKKNLLDIYLLKK